MRRLLLLALVTASLCGACDDDRRPLDAALPDGGLEDAGAADAGFAGDSGIPSDGAFLDASTDSGPSDAGGGDAGDAIDGGPGDSGPGACESGTHRCGDACVSDTSVDSCGDRCSPCPEPEGATSLCDGTCGFACDAGLVACDGACVPASLGCGVALPDDTCFGSAACGAAGECIEMRCVCAEGYRSCGGGCCPIALTESSRAATEGQSVQLEFGPDGTAYVMVQTEVSTSNYALRLYTRAPGSRSILSAAATIPVSYDDETFDFAIRSDGTLFVAAAPDTGESAYVDLYHWQPGVTSPVMERLGSGFGFNIGVGLGIDGEDTVWTTWSRSRSGGLSAASVSAAGTRTFNLSASGTVAQSDVEVDPISGDVFSFWGHRYTGTFRSGVAQLEGDSTLTGVCPADDAEFDSTGRVWSVFNSYSSIETHLCRGGTSRRSRSFVVRGDVPNAFDPGFALDGADVAFMGYYVPAEYTAYWLTTVDGERFARGALPVSYVNPSGSSSAGRAFVDVARRPDGGISMVVVPEDASMGPMKLIDF